MELAVGEFMSSIDGLSIAPGVAVFIGIVGAVAMFTIGLLVRMKRTADAGFGPGDDIRSVVYAINHLTYSVDRIAELLEGLLGTEKKSVRQRRQRLSKKIEVPIATAK